MTHALVIARRDLAERSSIFIAAAAMAVLPFVLVFVPGMQSFKRADVLTTAGGILSVGFALGLAILLGATMVGRDLSEKRMSFYFSKPVSAAAIWFGKLLAAFVTIAACFAIIFFPSYISSPVSWQGSWNVDLPWGFALIGTAAVIVLLLGHVFGTMFRSKSPLIALDLVLLVVAGFAVVGILRPLLAGFAADLTARVSLALLGAILVILLLCGVWQLAKGRADRRQNHIELSRFVWISLAIVLAIGGAYSAWVVHIEPADLLNGEMVQPDNGSWGLLFGRAKHRMDYHGLFAYDLASGDAVRVDGVRSWFSSGFSRDGRSVAYVKLPDLRAAQGELYVLPLRSGAKPEATRITVSRGVDYTFSDDGSRIAVMEGDGILTAYEIASKKALVSAKVPMPAHSTRRFFFVTPDLLRIYITPQGMSSKAEEHTLDIYELDIRTRGLQRTGSQSAVTKFFGVSVSPDGNRALLAQDDKASVIDARTAQVVATVPAGNMTHTTLLADGSVAVLDATPASDWTLTIQTPGGSGKQVAMGRMSHLFFSRELQGGLLVLTGSDKATGRSLYVVDCTRGSVIRHEPNLRGTSFVWSQWHTTDPRRAAADPRQPIATYDKANALYAWQPLTGAKKELLRF